MAHEDDHVVAALAELCRTKNIKCIVQIGAGDGFEADYVRTAIGCRAVAIEGDTRQPKHYGIEYHNTLIGATDSMTTFYLNNTPDLSTQIKRGDGEEAAELRQHRLDTFCAYHGIKPDGLIIDTEGTTLDVLEGAGDLLAGIKMIYAECQTTPFRDGMRIVPEIDALLCPMGFTQHRGLPSYDGGAQGNYTWVRP